MFMIFFQACFANYYLYADARTLIMHCDNQLPIDSTDLKVLYKINMVSKLAYFMDDETTSKPKGWSNILLNGIFAILGAVVTFKILYLC